MTAIPSGSPALFLDRDGVIISDSGYAKNADQVTLLPEISALIRRARHAGWKIVVVTNQSGLGRGWIQLPEYQAVSGRMLQLLAAEKAAVDRLYFAPFYEPEGAGPAHLQSPGISHHGVEERGLWSKAWRKPMPGMLWTAARDLNVNLADSVMIGDRATDQVAGFLAGLKRTYFLKSAVFEAENEDLKAWGSRLQALHSEADGWWREQGWPGEPPAPVAKMHPIEIETFAEVSLS